MIGKLKGDRIEGEKIILEASQIKLVRNVVRSQGHHGNRAIGRKHAISFVVKEYGAIDSDED